MKILFDPIYTADIGKCATAVKYFYLAENLLMEVKDCFIYWCIPDNLTEHDAEWLPKDDRITYLTTPYEKDRYKEYWRISPQLENALAYFGDNWDWDVCVTSRTAMVPTMRSLSRHRSGVNHQWMKPVILLEDFPLMSFKKSAASIPDDLQDISTINGYLSSTEVCISAYWEKSVIIDKAKKYFAPSAIEHFRKHIHEASPRVFNKTELKTKTRVLDTTKPFTIVFAGRMVNGHKFDKIFKIMESNWILKSGQRPIRCVVCTQSKDTGRVDVPDFVELKKLGRDDFWKFMREEADVGVFFSDEEDYSMSLIEPLILGVPYAVYDAKWSRASLGEDYPHFFTAAQDAYGVVKLYFDEYAKNYLTYAKWSREKFLPILLKRNELTIFTVVLEAVRKVEKEIENFNPYIGDTLALLIENLDGAPASFPVLLERAEKNGVEIRHLKEKLEGSQNKVTLPFVNFLYLWKVSILCAKTKGREVKELGTYYKDE